MALQDAIKRLRYVFTSEGADKVAADIQKVNQSQTTTEKSSLSLDQAFAKLERRFIDGVRAQQDYQKIQAQVNAAVSANPALQERAGAVLAAVNERYNQGTLAQRAFATATSGVSGQLIALSAGAGPVGVFLSSLGPWGIAAAGGIGLVTSALSHMKEEAARVGDKAVEVKKFSEATGLTSEEIRGLGKIGKEFGVSSEEMATSIERFTVNLDAARSGSGDLYEKIRKIDPALADQLAASRSAAAGWDVFAQALKRANDAGDVVQRNALSRAGFGRGGIDTGLVAARSADLGGVDAAAAKFREASGITNEWVENVARLRRENEQLEKQIADMKANAYAQEVLERQNQFLRVQKQITELLIKGGSTNAGDQAAIGVFGGIGGAELKPKNTLAEDAGINDIAKSVGNSAKNAIDPLDELRSQLAKVATGAEKAQSALGQYGETVDRLRTQQQKLTSAFLNKVISEEQYTKANDALQQQITYVEQLRAKWGGVSGETAKQLETLSQQTAVTQARTGAEQISLQYQQTITNLLGQGRPLVEAIAIAEAERAKKIAEVNAGLDKQLDSLRLQAEVLRGATELDQARIKAAQDYQKAVDAGGDSLKAAQIAAQSIANARTTIDARDQAQADANAASAAQNRAQANQAAAAAAAREAAEMAKAAAQSERVRAAMAFIPFGVLGPGGTPGWGTLAYVMGKTIFDSNQGGYSQFRPEGYKSTIAGPASFAKSLGGLGGADIDQTTGQPTSEGLTKLVNNVLTKGGTVLSAIDALLNQKAGFGQASGLTSGTLQELQQLTDLLPDSDKASVINRELAQLKAQPQNIDTLNAIKSLTDSLNQLKQSTDANTAAITDVLSPFYSQDPRNMRLGFRAFAGGGIMSPWGELPIKNYAGGGVAYTPQMSIFGEGSVPEAYVPVPSGRIPVEMRQPANSNQRPIMVNVSMTANVSRDEARKTGFQIAQSMKRALAS